MDVLLPHVVMVILWLGGQQWLPDQSTRIPIRGTVIVDSVDTCKTATWLRVGMKVRLQLKNVSPGAVILDRDWSERGWRILTRDGAPAQETSWQWLDGYADKPNYHRADKTPGSQFPVLKTGDTLAVVMEAFVELTPPDHVSSVTLQLGAENTDYRFWTQQEIHQATQEWAALGALWTEGVKTEPFTVLVDPKRGWRNCS